MGCFSWMTAFSGNAERGSALYNSASRPNEEYAASMQPLLNAAAALSSLPVGGRVGNGRGLKTLFSKPARLAYSAGAAMVIRLVA